MSNYSNKWTNEDTETMFERLIESATCAEIAEELGRTPSAIEQQLLVVTHPIKFRSKSHRVTKQEILRLFTAALKTGFLAQTVDKVL